MPAAGITALRTPVRLTLVTLASDDGPPTDDEKAAARRRVRAARQTRSQTGPAAAIPADPVVAILHRSREPASGPPVVACYLAMPGEPDPAPVITALHAVGARVIVPAVRGADLTWHEFGPNTQTELAAGGPPIREAQTPALPASTLDTCSAILLPALTVDRAGHRLGQGGGFYDRTLANRAPFEGAGASPRRPVLIAVVFADEFVDEFPSGLVHEHDVRVDAVLSEDGLTWCSRLAQG